MKICTITCHHAINHGAMLQAYALAEHLKNDGNDVEIIDYLPDYLEPRPLFYQSSKFKKNGLGWLYAIVKFKGNYALYKRRRVFEKFFYKYLTITKKHYRCVEELKETPPVADVYIAGSDQIWNTEFRNGMDSAFYLDFGDKRIRRISYAASFATNNIAQEKVDFVKKELSNFDSISVRESSAVLLSKKLGYEAFLVVDPVFLLKREAWDNLLESDKHSLPQIELSQKYLLVYDFMDDECIWAIAKRLSDLKGWKIYSIFKNRLADQLFYYYGPTTFVHLIKHAQCVVSNSFHGTAFSIIYQKDFFVINREDGLNIRMYDLLNHYGIGDRLINTSATDDVLGSHINYKIVNDTVCSDVARSNKWLKNKFYKI